jgi:DNA-binding LacI/PurR family transcriptional regulator
MTVRMKDIARDLGASVVTVSKVLRNQEDPDAVEMGRRAAQLALRVLAAKTRAKAKEVFLRPSLVVRASSVRPKAAVSVV